MAAALAAPGTLKAAATQNAPEAVQRTSQREGQGGGVDRLNPSQFWRRPLPTEPKRRIDWEANQPGGEGPECKQQKSDESGDWGPVLLLLILVVMLLWILVVMLLLILVVLLLLILVPMLLRILAAVLSSSNACICDCSPLL